MSRRTGLIDSAVESLSSRIASGEWPVGSRIPPGSLTPIWTMTV